VVVATNEIEITRLKELHQRGTANGLNAVRWLTPEQLREIEPHAAGVAALHVPEEGIVDYNAVCQRLVLEIEKWGGSFHPNSKVTAIRETASGWVLATGDRELETNYLINCGGLFCDRIAALAGIPRDIRIVPFRGEYYQLAPSAQHLVRNLIYPVPDPAFPFLGVHFTRLIHGGIEAGPNAVLAWAREGYQKTDWNLRDMADAMLFPGLWSFLRQYPGMAYEEVIRSFSRKLFAQSLQKLVPEIQKKDLAHGGSGVRAQAMLSNGTLVQDFTVIQKPKALHILNAPSPAATASLAIAEEIVNTLANNTERDR